MKMLEHFTASQMINRLLCERRSKLNPNAPLFLKLIQVEKLVERALASGDSKWLNETK